MCCISNLECKAVTVRRKRGCFGKNTALRVDNVGVRFRMANERVDNIKDYITKFMKHELRYHEFWALKDINFQVNKGERLGVLGLNGAGKSTLLKVIAGVLKPTEGTLQRGGKIVPLLELGAGFENQYTGKENVFLYGAMLGYQKEFLKERYEEIVAFSELGDFINVPLKNYSSGMKARLGFSIATIVEPEILILDEVLSVGDAKFKKKARKKLRICLTRASRCFLSRTPSGRCARSVTGRLSLRKGG